MAAVSRVSDEQLHIYLHRPALISTPGFTTTVTHCVAPPVDTPFVGFCSETATSGGLSRLSEACASVLRTKGRGQFPVGVTAGRNGFGLLMMPQRHRSADWASAA